MGGMFSGKKDFNPLHAKGWLDPLGAFDSPAAPAAPVVPPPAPTVDNSQGALDVAAQQQAQAMARGRSATLLTSGSGLNNLGSTSKTLLGQ